MLHNLINNNKKVGGSSGSAAEDLINRLIKKHHTDWLT